MVQALALLRQAETRVLLAAGGVPPHGIRGAHVMLQLVVSAYAPGHHTRGSITVLDLTRPWLQRKAGSTASGSPALLPAGGMYPTSHAKGGRSTKVSAVLDAVASYVARRVRDECGDDTRGDDGDHSDGDEAQPMVHQPALWGFVCSLPSLTHLSRVPTAGHVAGLCAQCQQLLNSASATASTRATCRCESGASYDLAVRSCCMEAA